MMGEERKMDDSKDGSLQEQAVVKQFESIKLHRGGGGYLLRKVVGDSILCDPFILVDHIGPEVYGPEEALGAPDHPHRGIDIMTYVINGGVKHEDSLGNQGVLREGSVQWMTCGSGLIHSEMPTEELARDGGPAEGFQVWINLPKEHKMSQPRYQDRRADEIPRVDHAGGHVKVLAGHCDTATSTIATRTPLSVLDLFVKQGSSYTLKVRAGGYNTVCYCWRGSGEILETHHRLDLGDAILLASTCSQLTFSASSNSDVHILVLSGEPIGETCVMFGPFVMDTVDGIRQAIADYQEGALGEIPGKEERIALNEARHSRYITRTSSSPTIETNPEDMNSVD